MQPDSSLQLYEEVLLLALRDERGTVQGTWYAQAIAGAILADLLLDGHLEIARDGKTVEIGEPDGRASRADPGIGDPLLLEAYELVCRAKRPKSLQSWLNKIAGRSELRHRAAERLCLRGTLRADREKVLLFFSRRVYPELDHTPEQELIDRLAALIHSDSKEAPDPRTLVLLSLAYHTELLGLAFDKKVLKARKSHIEALIEGDPLAEAAQAVIQSIHAAILVAAILPTIT